MDYYSSQFLKEKHYAMNNGHCRDFKRKDILLQRYNATVRFNPYQNTDSNLQAFLLIKNLRIRDFVDCTLRMDTQNVNCSAVALQRIKHPIRRASLGIVGRIAPLRNIVHGRKIRCWMAAYAQRCEMGFEFWIFETKKVVEFCKRC